MHSRQFTICFLELLATCLSGCVSDISHDARYQTDYAIDGIYRVKKPLFLDRGQRSIFGTWDYRILQLPNSRIAGIPSSVAQYEQERAHDWPNIAGVVAVETRIRVTKFKLERNPEMGRSVWIEGLILDGDLAGTKDVELSFISRKIRDKEGFVDVPMVDDEILERMVKP
jgi:hypothetical protein